jgi:hypothetical protein
MLFKDADTLGGTMGWLVIGVAIAMLASMNGWNAAAHRLDLRAARILSILFFFLTAVFVCLLVKAVFF